MRTAFHLVPCLALLGTFVIEDPFYCSEPPDHRQLAITHLEQGHFDQALMSARRAARQHRADGSLYLIMALAHLGRDRPDPAIQALHQAFLIEPDNEQIHDNVRQILRQEERFDAARELYTTLLDRIPDHAQGHAGLGWAYIELGDEEKALPALERALALGDSNLFARLQLGRMYADRDSLEQATRLLTEALTIDPDHHGVLLQLGEYQLRQGALEEANDTFLAALKRSEERAATAAHIAQVYYARNLRRKAIEYYERAMEVEPLKPLRQLVLNNLAWTYAEEGLQLERALELSLQSIKTNEDNVVYLDTYAELQHKTGAHRRAIALMHRALEIEPLNGEHYAYLQGQMQKFVLALNKTE